MKKHFSVKPLIIAAAISTTAVTSLITANAASDLSTDKHITEETQPDVTKNNTTTAPADTDTEATQPDVTENNTTTAPADTIEDENTYNKLEENDVKDIDVTVNGQKATALFQSYKHDDGKETSWLFIYDNIDSDWGRGFCFDGGEEVLDNLQNSDNPFTYEVNGKTVTVDFLPNSVKLPTENAD